MNYIFPTPLREDSTRDDAEAKSDFWSSTGVFICRHHVEPRVKLYMPKEETFLIPMKYIDVTITTFSSLDVLLEKNIDDYWNVDEDRELSDAWTGFTEVDTRAKRRRKSCVQVATCSDESIFFHSDKFLLRIKSDCI